MAVERMQHLANDPVGFHQEIAVLADVGFALPRFRRNDRRVWAAQRQVEEKRLVPLLGPGVDERAGLAGKVAQTIYRLEILRARAGPVECLGHRCPGGRLVVLQVNIWKHVERRGDDERFVKAAGQRAAADFFAVVNLPAVALGRAALGLAFFAVGQHLPAKAEVPLANDAGVIAVLLQKLWRGESIGGDERLRQPPKDAFLQRAPPIVAACDDAVAGWRADRRRRVGVGEAHSFVCQAVAVRRPRLPSSVREIAITKIVGKNENNIRLVGGMCQGETKQRENREKQQFNARHKT